MGGNSNNNEGGVGGDAGSDGGFLSGDEDIRTEMPLGEGVLKVNLGIPVLILCNKIDVIHMNSEKAKLIQENLDFIQKHVREYALQYGATVMFTSAKPKESHNLEVFYSYAMNRLYDFDFVSKPQVAEKEALFIPSGFDSLNLIRELCRGNVLVQGADGSDLSYTEVMVPLFQVLKDDKGRLGSGGVSSA